MKCATVVVLFYLMSPTYQLSTPEDSHYVAAVLEYNRQDSTALNLAQYVDFIHEASRQAADIVVFPEMTLTIGETVVIPVHGLLLDHPVPALMPNLYDQVLVTLSAAAREANIYVVVNVPEEMDCADAPGELCPTDEVYQFNTNVVFDRTGAVIDRYRKIHLFGERGRTPALTPDLGVFSTDFGVTFGHMICFDLMFQVPATAIPQQANITDVIFTTMWFAEMPFLTAVSIQEAYAYTHDVNFLASGANNVLIGSGGSGIFSGKAGALISVMPGVTTTRMLVSKVPKVPGQIGNETYPGLISNEAAVMDTLFLKRDQSILSHTSRVLQPGVLEDFELIDGEVTCHFRVNLTSPGGEVAYLYRATAFDGVRTFDGLATGGSRVCSVVACTDSDLSSCGTRFSSYAPQSVGHFHELSITSLVPTPTFKDLIADATYFPTTLKATIVPLQPRQFELVRADINNNRTEFFMRLNSDAELLCFGLWGRIFESDGLDATAPSSASSVRVLTVFMVLTPFIVLFSFAL